MFFGGFTSLFGEDRIVDKAGNREKGLGNDMQERDLRLEANLGPGYGCTA